ncbi:indole-3-cutyric acid response 5, partial [Striga asiatica]
PACQNLYKNSFTYHFVQYDLKLLFDDAIQFLLESSLLEYYNIVFYSSSRIAYQLSHYLLKSWSSTESALSLMTYLPTPTRDRHKSRRTAIPESRAASLALVSELMSLLCQGLYLMGTKMGSKYLFSIPPEFMAEGESNEINYMYDTITLLI